MEDLSTKILSQTTDSIQKLFDITTRIDERVKTCIDRCHILEEKIQEIVEVNFGIKESLAVLKSQDSYGVLGDVNSDIHKLQNKLDHLEQTSEGFRNINVDVHELQNKLSHLEQTSEGFKSNWDAIVKFIVQIIWLVVGAWILFKLGLAPPNLP